MNKHHLALRIAMQWPSVPSIKLHQLSKMSFLCATKYIVANAKMIVPPNVLFLSATKCVVTALKVKKVWDRAPAEVPIYSSFPVELWVIN